MTKYFTFVKNNSVTQYGLLPIRDVSGKTYHCQGVIDKLNALHEENQQIKSTIKEAYETERTHIGKNVLKQLIEQME